MSRNSILGLNAKINILSSGSRDNSGLKLNGTNLMIQKQDV